MLHRCYERFRQFRTPVQEDKVCKQVMNRSRLIRLLTKKLEPSFNLSSWMLQQKVTEAVNDAMAESDELDELIEQLHSRVVRFSYRKADGSVREALGTLKPSMLDKLLAGQQRKRNGFGSSDRIVYYDLDCEDWRCFNPENYISMD